MKLKGREMSPFDVNLLSLAFIVNIKGGKVKGFEVEKCLCEA